MIPRNRAPSDRITADIPPVLGAALPTHDWTYWTMQALLAWDGKIPPPLPPGARDRNGARCQRPLIIGEVWRQKLIAIASNAKMHVNSLVLRILWAYHMPVNS